MKLAVKLSCLSSLILSLAIPAWAGVTVNSPTNNEEVASPFKLSADEATCSSQPVSAMGYSLDSSTDNTIVNGTAVDTSVAAGTGAHTVHVKAWGDKGSVCVTDVAITVIAGSTAIPSSAISVGGIQTLGNWKAGEDTATGGGAATGSMSLVNSPSRSGNARKFMSKYANYGGERYYVSFGDDTESTNFVYDAWVYLPSPYGAIANLEMDMNQVMSNGQTVIFGFQCDGWNGTWDYTANAGTPAKPKDEWLHSKAACNPRNWSTNTWHHVQIAYSRDDSGNVTYRYVTFDGAQSNINATVKSAFALGWSPSLLTNFQVDSSSSGSASSVAYLDDITIYRW
jgi:hypothetical protein